jgi:hypothetical protein
MCSLGTAFTAAYPISLVLRGRCGLLARLITTKSVLYGCGRKIALFSAGFCAFIDFGGRHAH